MLSKEYSQKHENNSCKSNKIIQRMTPVMNTLNEHQHPQQIIQRVQANPNSLTHTDAMVLQRAIGNRAVMQLLSEAHSKQKITAEDKHPQITAGEAKNTKSGNKTGMPDKLKAGVENLSGLSMEDVKVHYNSDKPRQLGAMAYTQGTDIHIAPGQERHLPHEAWHVVQQKQGRVQPTMQMKGLHVNDDNGLEKEADQMGERAVDYTSRVDHSMNQSRHLMKKVAVRDSIQMKQQNSMDSLKQIAGLRDDKSYHMKDDREYLSNMESETVPYKKKKSKEEQYSDIAKKVKKDIDEAVDKSEDTIELSKELEKIKKTMGLKAIRMVKLGTPNAAVEFQINPWFTHQITGGKVIYRMEGKKAISDIRWDTENLNVGTQTAKVGKHMIANPLAPDFEPGSQSTNDSEQNGMMAELANAGNTSVPNDQKYIKGHLLNDHVGGPGLSYNLFPITADANAKHLAYVEKFVKAQLLQSYVICYELQVSHGTPKAIKGNGIKPFSIDADFNFCWFLLDTSGKQIKAQHKNKIQSIYNVVGSPPFDVITEYTGEYNKLNIGKGTPVAIAQPNQWNESSIKPTGMSPMSMPTTNALFSMPQGFLGTTMITKDYSKIAVYVDASNKSFFSVRSKDAPSIGEAILVNTGVVETVKSLSLMAGGWTRVYF